MNDESHGKPNVPWGDAQDLGDTSRVGFTTQFEGQTTDALRPCSCVRRVSELCGIPLRAPLAVGSSCNCKAARFVLSRASDFDQDTPACDGGAVTLCEPVTLLHCGAASLSRVSTQVPSLWRSPRACRCKVLPPPPHTPAGRCETPRRPRW